MTQNELLVFIQRIVESSSQTKSTYALKQLEEILRNQGADREMITIITNAQKGLPEVQQMAKVGELSKADIETAVRRAEERRRREEAMRHQGRS